MTKKEQLMEILNNIPDELVNKAYVIDLGGNGFRVALEFEPEYLKHYPPDKFDFDQNGFLRFFVEAGGEKVEITMT